MRNRLSTATRPHVLYMCIIIAGLAPAAAHAAEPAELEEIRSCLQDQRETITSLHIRVARETAVLIDRDVLLGWRHEVPLPEHRGTDEALFAFKGKQRYRRVVAFDCIPVTAPEHLSTALGSPSDQTPKWLLPYVGKRNVDPVDNAAACGPETFFQRQLDLNAFEDEFQYHSVRLDEVHDSLPPSPYLINVGLAVPDPTAKDEAQRNLHDLGLLTQALQRWPYAVAEEMDRIEGKPCTVLEAKIECILPGDNVPRKKTVRDKLWLAPEHGLALRKRETWVGGQLRRVINSDFTRIVPGVWLPRQSRTETFAPTSAPTQYQDRPAWARNMTLRFWVVNQTPDDFFKTALAKPEPLPRGSPWGGCRHRAPPLHLVPALHYTIQWGDIDKAPNEAVREEFWAIKDLGQRREFRAGTKLQRLEVDDGRWSFSWDPDANRVAAYPSLGNWIQRPQLPINRASVIRYAEEITGVFALRKERLNGKEVDKLTVYFPAIRQPDGRLGNAHSVAEIKRAGSATEFCARHFWFDPKTNLWFRRDCGCKPPGYRETLDYPPPESVPRDLFEFKVPPDAVLEVDDPALGRPVLSEGHPEPHSPQ